MKRILFFALAFVLLGSLAIAKPKKPAPTPPEGHINWISMDELQGKMRQAPKRVYIDMYTDWCGWCKKMEATTFTQADVAAYMNANFYCVRFNAERKDTIRFMGKQYYFDPERRAHTLAIEWMHGQMSYPTSVFMDPYFQNPNPIPGYQDVKTMEMLLRFFCEVPNRNQATWEAYQKSFSPTWGMSGPVTSEYPPIGH